MSDDTLSPPPWLRLRDVSFSHGRQPALRHITLDFLPGRHYIVAGPNGAGKSTLLDLLANLKTPGGGSVEIMGAPPGDRSPRALARLLSLAPQEYRLDFPFTVRETVAMGRRPHLGRWGRLSEGDRRAVGQALAAVDLEGQAGKSVTALSGGERRRCVVARALAQATPVLLLDEPISGLDVAHALSIMALARRLAEGGSLVVTVSHDLNLAAAYGHEIVFLKDGAVSAAGPVDAVFTDAVLTEVYDTEARVRPDPFAGGLAVSFKKRP